MYVRTRHLAFSSTQRVSHLLSITSLNRNSQRMTSNYIFPITSSLSPIFFPLFLIYRFSFFFYFSSFYIFFSSAFTPSFFSCTSPFPDLLSYSTFYSYSYHLVQLLSSFLFFFCLFFFLWFVFFPTFPFLIYEDDQLAYSYNPPPSSVLPP